MARKKGYHGERLCNGDVCYERYVFPADVPIAERWDNCHAFCFNTQSTSRHFTSCCHGKLILFLCLIKHHSKNAYTYVGEEVQLHIFLTSALDRSVFSFMLGIIYSRGRVMEREAVRETEPSGNLECRKIFCFDRKSNTIFYHISRILVTA